MPEPLLREVMVTKKEELLAAGLPKLSHKKGGSILVRKTTGEPG